MPTIIFHPFPLLPLELRLKIFSYHLPSPRIVDIIAISTELSGFQPFHVSSEDEGSGEIKWVRRFVDHLQAPRQEGNVLLFVNRETRALILKRWKVVKDVEVFTREQMSRIAYERFEDGEMGIGNGPDLGSGGQGWKATGPERMPGAGGVESVFYLHPPPHSSCSNVVLFNSEQDVLFLADPPSTRKVSSLSVLVRWLEREVVESVKYLAVPYYSWRKDYKFGFLGCLTAFESAERVWVCFVGDDGVNAGGGWLAAVSGVGRGRDREGHSASGARDEDEGDVYLVEVREQVRGDVESERTLDGWKRPAVRVVRDRGCLMDELRGMEGANLA